MNDLLIYAAKVTACSALLYAYYVAALRNRPFHRFNRFYLLAILPLSLAVPLLRWTITTGPVAGSSSSVNVLRIVGSANDLVEGNTAAAVPTPSLEGLLGLAYGAVSLALLIVLLRSLFRLGRLLRTHKSERFDSFRLYPTNLASAPFTFFKNIFWNRAIDRGSDTGRRILAHEIVHARQRHSLDILLVQISLIVFWCNPFFWLVRRELRQVHEFIADGEAVADGGSAELAAMILHASHPAQFQLLTQSFFQSPVKRRLLMLNHHRTPRLIGRLLALPLLAVAVTAFSVRTEKRMNAADPSFRIYTVVIDAGHGYVNGKPSGAHAEGVNEDDIVLAIAQQVQAAAQDPNLRIVLARGGAQSIDLKSRVAVAETAHADFFISLHMNMQQDNVAQHRSGIEVFVSRDSSLLRNRSLPLASALQRELGALYPAQPGLLELFSHVWVIDHNTCPAVLIELGYLSDEKDRSFMRTSEGQKQMAQGVLTALGRMTEAGAQ